MTNTDKTVAERLAAADALEEFAMIYMTVLAGNKSRHAWLIGLGNQALWLVFIIATGTWGLLPMNLALWIVYGRNHLKWNRA